MGMINTFINEVRHDFSNQELDEKSVEPTPIKQVEKWIQEAVDSKVSEANAMSICTVNQNGAPSSRIVYARGISEDGIILYTNYNSQKGQDLEVNPSVSLLFFYPELERQIRIDGTIQKLPEQESDNYFNARPTESKLGAWASEQSSTIESRATLEKRTEFFREKFGTEIPRPPHWGGYIVKPTKFEFWQGRPARLHDRLVFEKADKDWTIFRIAP
ncbi:MAG: pyridoxamine 5'-phosphate oxidase [Salibacteraceae bacterium]|nr:pyridoxamine 5'-phosphate oxidase [Salibacteraceae bacterium]|tara:strand:- start:28717 stop:29364 length:648 start_codon:yes stop_codon:yes gene_type:complete